MASSPVDVLIDEHAVLMMHIDTIDITRIDIMLLILYSVLTSVLIHALIDARMLIDSLLFILYSITWKNHSVNHFITRSIVEIPPQPLRSIREYTTEPEEWGPGAIVVPPGKSWLYGGLRWGGIIGKSGKSGKNSRILGIWQGHKGVLAWFGDSHER